MQLAPLLKVDLPLPLLDGVLGTTAQVVVRSWEGGENVGACGFWWAGDEDVEDEDVGDGEVEVDGLSAAMNVLAAMLAVLGDEPGQRMVGTCGDRSETGGGGWSLGVEEEQEEEEVIVTDAG